MGRFTHTTPKPVPRPAFWRLSQIQCIAWLLALGVTYALWPQTIESVFWAGLVTMAGQAFWIWRSLRGFGDPHSKSYLAGTTAGLLGKWVIIGTGLILLWRSEHQISVAATVFTFFGLNTLAALTAPISISRPR
ncbi:MAG: hypothetical protein ACX931_02080 [Saccharospirillum sp.]